MTTDLDVAVVGAGAAGLAVAHALHKAGRRVQVLESSEAVGGRMRTFRHDGYLIDAGAEMLAPRGYGATWKLIRATGLTPAEVPRVPQSIATWRDGRIRPDTGRARGLLTGAGLSVQGRLGLLRFQADTARRRKEFDTDHPEHTPLGASTVARLADRYGNDLVDYLFQPLTSGFCGWDAHRSAAGPFVAHLLATGSTAAWRTYRDGMDTLTRRLAERLDVTTGVRVEQVTLHPGGARLECADTTLTARSVVLCVPAPVAARLYPDAPEDERDYLHASTYTPMLKVSCVLDRPLRLRSRRPVYALMIPAVHDSVLNGIVIDHVKHPGRVPPGAGLVSLIATPQVTRELLDAPDDQAVRLLRERGEYYLPGLGEALRTARVHRFRHGLPEATPRALRLRTPFLRRPSRAVEYAGDWLMQRPSSEGAFRSAEWAVARVLDHAGHPATGARPEVTHG
ncbi:protoporphyrinogen/coproporphyrinogen oxidase [Streptomyces purpurogeneiscleroticus]|uniref:protoporphyrinogen/coproporphyrinogen oxidase n=1 Tax=Streptomyces purpurogeneiscleroticus TaxID=68259 RepID=UPI001CBBEE34|nr:FAD-dependent oxidoreductase [Streptomyces purpurogeneiscleroticus]MBZ4016105.1 amine oxidase [Streptomyces purpurogeneiscleroticus]